MVLCAGNVLLSCILESCMVLLPHVNPVNSTKISFLNHNDIFLNEEFLSKNNIFTSEISCYRINSLRWPTMGLGDTKILF